MQGRLAVGVPRHHIGPCHPTAPASPSRATKCKIVAPSARTIGRPRLRSMLSHSRHSVCWGSRRGNPPKRPHPPTGPTAAHRSALTRARPPEPPLGLPSQSAGDAGRVARGAAVPQVALDRLGRNLAHLVNTVQDLAARRRGPAGARQPRAHKIDTTDRGRPPHFARRWPSSSGRVGLRAAGERRSRKRSSCFGF